MHVFFFAVVVDGLRLVLREETVNQRWGGLASSPLREDRAGVGRSAGIEKIQAPACVLLYIWYTACF